MAWKDLKTIPKLIIIGGGVSAAIFGFTKYGGGLDYLKPKVAIEASIPKFDTFGDKVAGTNAAPGQTPNTPSKIAVTPAASSYTAKVLTIPWNGITGLSYANGGVLTQPDSLMAKGGVKLNIERQDSYAQMTTELVKFATAVSKGDNTPTEGAAFAIIMGDGYSAFVGGAQEALSKVAKGQQLEVIGAIGYSRGEDKCIVEAGGDPKGSMIAGVLGDGDINICIQYASDNGIAVNTDQKTFNPDAMNFVGVDSFVDGDKKFIDGAKETRLNVKTQKREDIKVNGTATWTPGDVNVARHKKIRVLASTKEYIWQMPTVVIGNKQWMANNKPFVENMLAAAWQGGEIVRSNDTELMRAAATNAKIFKEEDAGYWAKYFKGTVENGVSLGGSTTIGLADNLFLFGLNGNDQLYKRIYNVFGQITVKYFPDFLKEVVPYESVVNTTYIASLASKVTDVSKLEIAKPSYTNVQTGATFAKKAVTVEFDSGKATLTPKGAKELNEVMDNLAVSGLVVEIRGHTDSVGNTEANMQLSKARAESVRKYIMANASSTFPEGRLRSKGYGDIEPIADNSTPVGRATNRRVEIVQLTTSN